MTDNKDEMVDQPIMAVAHPINEDDPNFAIAVPVPVDPNTNIPVAPSLHQYNDNSPAAQEHAVAQMARVGSDIGKIQAVEEKERIRQANARSRDQTFFERNRIQRAQNVAKQRDREGLDVREDLYFNHEAVMQNTISKKVQEQDAAYNAATRGKKGEGYEVKEYDVAEYQGEEYSETYEYKSIYD